MVGSFRHLAVLALVCLGLCGCVGGNADLDDDDSGPAPSSLSQPQRSADGGLLQCVPYARDHSAVTIYGDAYTWWDKAAGRFARSSLPSEGAVMVLFNYAGPNRGHVAVVREILDARTIKVDHANWLDDGAIYTDNPVRDESPDNDWSVVRVFNLKTGAWGRRLYPVQGFIGPGPDSGDSDSRIAQTRVKRDAISLLLNDDDSDDGGTH